MPRINEIQFLQEKLQIARAEKRPAGDVSDLERRLARARIAAEMEAALFVPRGMARPVVKDCGCGMGAECMRGTETVRP